MLVYKQQENEAVLENKVERMTASVKWYKPEKGYGFLIGEGNSPDIMIHFSTLDKVGCAYINSGDRVICDVAFGESGAQVIRVVEVKFGYPGPRPLPGICNSLESNSLQEIKGIIKWYNPDKGYGFIRPDEGREIFVHASVLRAAGYESLQPDLRVLAKVIQSERGPIARMIRVLYENNR